MYCRNCGKELVYGLEECPFCHYTVDEEIAHKKAKNYNENKKWIPYFMREDSIYKKHPFLAWSITIIIIVGGLWLMNYFSNEATKNALYNAGYKDGLNLK